MARILVVDDDAQIRLLFRLLLEDAGLEAQEAPSGALALELCAGWHPDLVIADLGMSDMNGYELLERLSEMQPGLRVIVVTGRGYETTARLASAGARLGVLDFLQKPMKADRLLAVVARVLAAEVA